MIANQNKQIKDFMWLLANEKDILADEFTWGKCLLLRNQSIRDKDDSKYAGVFESIGNAVKYIVDKEEIKEYILYECKLSELSYLSSIESTQKLKNIYRTYLLVDIEIEDSNSEVSNHTYISRPYILMEVGDYMPIGAQVYHKLLKLNLIVCQISTGNMITCINPEIHTDGVFQTLVAKSNQLELGWKIM